MVVNSGFGHPLWKLNRLESTMQPREISSGWRRAVPAVVAAAAALCLSACVVAPAPVAYGEPAVVAPVAPPAPYAESITVAPAPGYIWIGGYWGWVGGRYMWRAGHWEAPRRGYHWVPRSWVAGPGGWHQRGGRWEGGGGRLHEPPPQY
ncbi:MAG: hypothetical protein OJF60_000882 [Burkholderiaceae bacterium]|jgi:hypothetical protein|nr:MAG: hypothetical protein OJF60_000882 [Burkholderiaceae bacterium]